ncbi:precorrin-2 C(20)-methyltransferase [Thermosynechococcaceae cyanobacterium Okahandja]
MAGQWHGVSTGALVGVGLVATLWGIGAGPGDPELMTLKGWRQLQAAPVVAFPAGVRGRVGVAEQIIDSYLAPQQVRVPLEFPYVLEQEVLHRAWQAAAQTVYGYLSQGMDVAFVSEGDVSFYSTFTYLGAAVQQLDPTIAIETIPGICSPLAAAAALGVPLTCGRDRLAILPAMYHVEELSNAWAWADVLVLMKVRAVYPQVWQWLHHHNLLEQAAVVLWATTPQQRIYCPLTPWPSLDLPYFSLLLVWKHAPTCR